MAVHTNTISIRFVTQRDISQYNTDIRYQGGVTSLSLYFQYSTGLTYFLLEIFYFLILIFHYFFMLVLVTQTLKTIFLCKMPIVINLQVDYFLYSGYRCSAITVLKKMFNF